MTVGTATNRYDYDGDGVSTVFAFSSYFLSNADLKVYKQGILQTLGTNYTVTGAGNPSGGSVTFTVAPASGDDITLINDPPKTQLTDFVNNLTILAENVENALDKLTLGMQAIEEKIGRSIQQNNLGNFAANFNALSKRIENLGAGVSGSDAARVDQIQGLVSSFGNVPNPLSAQVGHLLRASAVDTFGWSPFQLSNVIVPPTLTGDVNDYNPTGLSDASVVKLQADADDRKITGIQAQTEGRIYLLENASNFFIRLVNGSASSLAENRFDFGQDIILQPKDSVLIRWRFGVSVNRWSILPRKGTAAIADTGISGHTVPFLDTQNIWSAFQKITLSISGAIVSELESTHDDASVGPILNLSRNPASSANDDDIGEYRWTGKNSSGTLLSLLKLTGRILDITAGSEDARLTMLARVAGALTNIITYGPGVQFGAPTGGDKGIGSLNIQGDYFKNNAILPTPLYKSAQQDVTSSTVLVNDNHFSFAVGANETWVAELTLFVSCSAAGDFKYDFIGPASPTRVKYGQFAAASDDTGDFGAAAAFNTSISVSSAGTTQVIKISFLLENGANAGTVNFRWAQLSSDATPTSIHKGSYMLTAKTGV